MTVRYLTLFSHGNHMDNVLQVPIHVYVVSVWLWKFGINILKSQIVIKALEMYY